ncbi:MAG: AraC-type DNA-binding protein [Verrucomicrobiaceae bacterium]|nr:AraC-type DNA-binding protein [Verrucomicrobiaceae bacterium]
MHPTTQELISFLTRQRAEVFDLTGRVDHRRYLGREFPADLPLLLSLQQYPAYQQMVGENWLHWHDYFECFLALSGQGDFYAGNDRFLFGPGDVVVVDPLKIHGVMRMEASHSALVILFPRHLIAPTETVVDVAFLGAWENRAAGVPPVLRADDEAAPALHEALLQLARGWFPLRADQAQRLPEMKLRLLGVLLQLRAAFASPEDLRANKDGDRALREIRLRRALDYVALHGHEAISQPDVARAAGMSTSRFRAFFKETTGWGFARYLREQRVERAEKWLRESSESIATIAHRTGFADQSHLLRCFREKHGLAPKEYRRVHSKE